MPSGASSSPNSLQKASSSSGSVNSSKISPVSTSRSGRHASILAFSSGMRVWSIAAQARGWTSLTCTMVNLPFGRFFRVVRLYFVVQSRSARRRPHHMIRPVNSHGVMPSSQIICQTVSSVPPMRRCAAAPARWRYRCSRMSQDVRQTRCPARAGRG